MAEQEFSKAHLSEWLCDELHDDRRAMITRFCQIPPVYAPRRRVALRCPVAALRASR
jgi:hypothetical protein